MWQSYVAYIFTVAQSPIRMFAVKNASCICYYCYCDAVKLQKQASTDSVAKDASHYVQYFKDIRRSKGWTHRNKARASIK